VIAAQRLTVSEAVPQGRLVVTFTMTSQEHSTEPGPVHGSPSPPSALLRLDSERPWESGSPQLRLLAAAIADALAGRAWDGPTMQSVWLRVVAEAEGRVGLNGRSLPADVDQELSRALLGPSMLDQVIGYTDDDGHFRPGIAALTPQEREAVNFWLSPNEEGKQRSAPEIRDLMDRKRRRYGLPLAIETVEGHLSRARRKLREMARAS